MCVQKHFSHLLSGPFDKTPSCSTGLQVCTVTHISLTLCFFFFISQSFLCLPFALGLSFFSFHSSINSSPSPLTVFIFSGSLRLTEKKKKGFTITLSPLPKYPPFLHSISQDDRKGGSWKRRRWGGGSSDISMRSEDINL